MIKESNDGVLFEIKVIPNSSKNDIIIEGDVIKLKITALPVDNKANKAVIEYLAKYLKVPKTSLSVVKGQCSKDKKIFINIPLIEKKLEVISKLTM